MERGVKIGIASLVLMAGVSVAMFFRRPAADRPTALMPVEMSHDATQELVLLERVEPQAAHPVVVKRRPVPQPKVDVALASKSKSTEMMATPPQSGPPPPMLSPDYSHASLVRRPLWETPLGMPFGRLDHSGRTERIHKIIDGDTLEALAELYLGNANRYKEIYEANRDILTNIDLLPIGTELRIPSLEIRPNSKSVGASKHGPTPKPDTTPKPSAAGKPNMSSGLVTISKPTTITRPVLPKPDTTPKPSAAGKSNMSSGLVTVSKPTTITRPVLPKPGTVSEPHAAGKPNMPSGLVTIPKPMVSEKRSGLTKPDATREHGVVPGPTAEPQSVVTSKPATKTEAVLVPIPPRQP